MPPQRKYQGSGQEARDDAAAAKANKQAADSADSQINTSAAGLGAIAAARGRKPAMPPSPTPTMPPAAPTPRPIASITTPMDRWNGRG